MARADAWSPADLEKAVGVRFDDRGLLIEALTHRSYVNEDVQANGRDNERLEFLGDALVDFVAGAFLYRRLPEAREGDLTALRASLVCEAATARYSVELRLGTYLRLGKGEEASGGRDRPALLGDAFEALAAAVLLDQGYATAESFILRFLEPELAAVLAGERALDAKSRFQEVAQYRWQTTPEYQTVAEEGPDHDKRFLVRVVVGDREWGRGEGRSKASAARRAAAAALDRLARDGGDALADQAACEPYPGKGHLDGARAGFRRH